jgi:hypothetical protein
VWKAAGQPAGRRGGVRARAPRGSLSVSGLQAAASIFPRLYGGGGSICSFTNARVLRRSHSGGPSASGAAGYHPMIDPRHHLFNAEWPAAPARVDGSLGGRTRAVRDQC